MQDGDNWMVFLTLVGANLAQGIISANMGLPKSGGDTARWAVPYLRSDLKYVIQKPEDRYMTGLAGVVFTVQQIAANLL